MNTASGEDYCRQKAAAAGTNFYYSTLYYPADCKRDLFALHAFAAEIEQILEECSDPGVARLKLAWWQEEIQRLFRQEARHPVTRELARLSGRLPLAEASLRTFIHHHERRINPEPCSSYHQLMEFLADGPGALWRLTAAICGARAPATPETVSRMGSAFAVFYLLQNKRNKGMKALSPDGHRDAMARTIEQLVADLETCYQTIPAQDRHSQLSSLIMARLIITTCKEIARDGYRLEQQRTSLTPLRKLWIAWRTYRKVMRDE